MDAQRIDVLHRTTEPGKTSSKVALHQSDPASGLICIIFFPPDSQIQLEGCLNVCCIKFNADRIKPVSKEVDDKRDLFRRVRVINGGKWMSTSTTTKRRSASEVEEYCDLTVNFGLLDTITKQLQACHPVFDKLPTRQVDRLK